MLDVGGVDAMDETGYCDIVMYLANTEGNYLFEEVEEDESHSPCASPTKFQGGAGQEVHPQLTFTTPPSRENKLYTKSETLKYSESIVFGKLQTMYDALVGTQSDFEYDDIVSDICNVFGYVFFLRYDSSVRNISQLSFLIGVQMSKDNCLGSDIATRSSSQSDHSLGHECATSSSSRRSASLGSREFVTESPLESLPKEMFSIRHKSEWDCFRLDLLESHSVDGR